jgi:hypothetical protein
MWPYNNEIIILAIVQMISEDIMLRKICHKQEGKYFAIPIV